jgi:hypothetical protein
MRRPGSHRADGREGYGAGLFRMDTFSLSISAVASLLEEWMTYTRSDPWYSPYVAPQRRAEHFLQRNNVKPPGNKMPFRTAIREGLVM